jgi:hypothetical protein
MDNESGADGPLDDSPGRPGLFWCANILVQQVPANIDIDLKMENVLLNGFENDAPGDICSIVARLADCGASKFTV